MDPWVGPKLNVLIDIVGNGNGRYMKSKVAMMTTFDNIQYLIVK
jgi:hypothetical protein